MTLEINKPNLPDPGGGRSWSITTDADGDYQLWLIEPGGYNSLSVDTVARVWAKDATPEKFEAVAATMITNQKAADVFVGTYTFEENK